MMARAPVPQGTRTERWMKNRNGVDGDIDYVDVLYRLKVQGRILRSDWNQ